MFGDWVSKIGLDPRPVPHVSGWLNRLERDLGTRPPFQQTVGVCRQCNNGWMSGLEVIAKRVLTPFILGESGDVAAADTGAIAMWVQKTAMTAMLASPAEDRSKGYGLPFPEYGMLYGSRTDMRPLPASQFWIGRYNGGRLASVRVTPIVMVANGAPEPDEPHGYAMTIIIGQLVLHGVRFTDLSTRAEAIACRSMPQLWPTTSMVTVPATVHLDDAAMLPFSRGADLTTNKGDVELRAWKPAVELPASEVAGDAVLLPTICGKHDTMYPLVLVHEAMHGRFYVFVVTCECPMAYLIHTEPDGAHCKTSGTTTNIAARYESLPDEELKVQTTFGTFFFKPLAVE